MRLFTSLLTPLLMAGVALYGAFRGIDVFDALLTGAKKGMKTMGSIFPALIVLLPGIYMLRASGALDFLTQQLAPLLQRLGVPKDCAPLLLLRPISGSGALAAASELIGQFGPDSVTGRTAAVMMGATETTFYVIAVYFGGAEIKQYRRVIPAALCADLAAFLTAAWASRLFFG